MLSVLPVGQNGAGVLYINPDRAASKNSEGLENSPVGGGDAFWACKRGFDVCFSLLLLIPMLVFMVLLLFINPLWNRGPLFYRQTRMGRNCRAFKAIKFRTMSDAKVVRGADDPIERHRITPLGRIFRISRIDELPQVLNVLRGDMSLIGPRPDYFVHAKAYLRCIPGYRTRHLVRPGISGLAQVNIGYAEGISATRAKVEVDLYYIRQAGFKLDMEIFYKTLLTVARQKGS